MASQKEEIKETRRRRLNWLIVAILVIGVTLLSLPSFEYFRVSDLEVGSKSPRSFVVDQKYRIVDESQTRQQLLDQKEEIQPEFTFLQSVKTNVLNNINSEIKELKQKADQKEMKAKLPETDREWSILRDHVRIIVDYLLDRGVIKHSEVFDRFKYQSFAKLLIHRSDKEQQDNLTTNTLKLKTLKERLVPRDSVRHQTQQLLNSLFPEYEHSKLVVGLIQANIRPNVSFNKNAFEEKIAKIEEKVDPYYISFSRGDVLLSKGEVVTEKHIEVLNAINNKRIRLQFTTGAASLGIVLAALIFLFFYLREFNPDLFAAHNKLALLTVLTLIFVGLAKITDLLHGSLPPSIEYAIPFAAPVMLVTLMVSEGVAFLFGIFMAFIIVSFFNMSIELLAMLILGALTGIFTIRKVERRITLLRSGLLIGAVQVLIIICFHALRTGSFSPYQVVWSLAWGGFNGAVLVPFTVLGLLPFLENGFGITTNFRLLELADLNHPLLQRLFREAPGTFQHSVMLSNLCEQAARAIGANALLVRVGCYYHDLGKAENPEYFIENQEGINNPHDELKPTLSASILKAHVKKGSQVARDAGLPREIVDLIEQHHGTTLMKPFYHDALKEDEGNVSKENFQYPGPLPQTREAGLCMLGDSVEAACRALEDPTPQKIKERISNIVNNKFSGGQLNECDLTLKDLNTIIETFTRVLTSVYHRRIEYPDAESPEELEKKLPSMEPSVEES
ncbi:MAG: HD family phosphohydrolase [bacterium]